LFCILEIKEKKKRLFKKNYAFYAEKRVIPGLAVFEKLTAYSYNGKVDFPRLREHLRGFSRWIVLSDGCVLPPDSGLFSFSSNELKKRLVFNSAVSLLKQVGREYPNVLLVDKKGDFSGEIEKIVPHVRNLTVMTESSLRYDYSVQEIFEDSGAVVKIIKWNENAPFSNVVISVSESGVNPLSISFLKTNGNKNIVLRGEGFYISDEILKYKPENISFYPFAGALYSLSSVKTLGEGEFNSFIVNNRVISAQSAVKMLDTFPDF